MPMTKVEKISFMTEMYFSLIKACVRAMDAVQQFTKQLGITVPQKFFIGGASKVNIFKNLSFTEFFLSF
jgi:hypothetical protein